MDYMSSLIKYVVHKYAHILYCNVDIITRPHAHIVRIIYNYYLYNIIYYLYTLRDGDKIAG